MGLTDGAFWSDFVFIVMQVGQDHDRSNHFGPDRAPSGQFDAPNTLLASYAGHSVIGQSRRPISC